MRFILLSLFLLFASASAYSAERSVDGLWVTLDVLGGRYRVKVQKHDTEAAIYIRSFVAGRAPNRIPKRFARRWLAAAKLPVGAAEMHVVRAEECRDGVCVPLRGLYAGRSPAF